MNSEEEKYMLRCIQLAQNGLCNAAPNPMVGAVIVCDGKIIGEGYHVRCGEAHAEVNAIRSVKDTSLLKRSTIYVSLEPCSHYGKTPPCADPVSYTHLPRLGSRVRVSFSALFSLFRMLEWWNGRHEGLKILWPLRLCGFKSRFEYSIKLCESLICRAFSL